MTTQQKIITITEQAAEKVRELMKDDPEAFALRVAVAGGGCSGFQYQLGFDTEKLDEDTLIEMHDVKIVVDGVSADYLGGSEIDYQDGLSGKGFVVNNPNSTGTCGCGESFSC